ncbi:MAG TPA: VC0807 family protein [Acidimicrobiales bacterium]|nr:VC0807 family protein [Acidimicrobiales bacterium]
MAEAGAGVLDTCRRGPNGCSCWYLDPIAGDSREGAQQAAPETEQSTGSMASILHLPSPRAFVSHALPAIVESAIGPGVLFYLVLVTGGFKGALIAALVWSYLAAARRWVRRERIPASLVLSMVLLTARTVVSYATGSAFLYFVQPTATTFLVAFAFLVTAIVRRPFIERLARDFCPIDPELFKRPFLRRFFLRLSLLWALVLFVNAGTVLYFLFVSSVQGFVLERALISMAINGAGIAVSAFWFVRTMRGAGITVRWSGSMPESTQAG